MKLFRCCLSFFGALAWKPIGLHRVARTECWFHLRRSAPIVRELHHPSREFHRTKPSISLPLSPSKIPEAPASRFPNRPKPKSAHALQSRVETRFRNISSQRAPTLNQSLSLPRQRSTREGLESWCRSLHTLPHTEAWFSSWSGKRFENTRQCVDA